jgi:protein phosphatase-4 regulatory subunit 3
LLKSLLDNEVNEKKNDFYDLFYNKCLKNLADFLKIAIKEEFKYEMISSKQIVIEILCHCLKQHEQRVRYWIIHNDLISKVMEAIKDNSKILELQVTKFIKSVIVNNDDNLNKMIINNDIFSQIIHIFNRHKEKDNAILSAVLDLFEHIRKQNLKKLIAYLVKIISLKLYSSISTTIFSIKRIRLSSHL